MNKTEKVHTAVEVAGGLITTIKIDEKEHPTMKASFDIVSKVMPEIEDVIQDIVADKKPIDSSVKLGTKLFSIATADKGKVIKQGASKAKDVKKAMSNPEALKTVAVSNPYVLLVVIALAIIEKDVKAVLAVTKEILAFLEAEKEAEIEADVKTLSSIISKYTINFDNERFIASNHKMVLDIQRTARKNMLFYEKQISNMAKNNIVGITQSNVESYFKKLEREFKYYRMAIYTFSLSSFLEIILSGNFKEENVKLAKDEIDDANIKYSNYHAICLERIKKISHQSIESNTVKGTGVVTSFIGSLFAKSKKEKDIEKSKKLIAKGDQLKEKSIVIENTFIKGFEDLKENSSELFAEKMEEIIFIFNNTGQICCDENGIYLIEQ